MPDTSPRAFILGAGLGTRLRPLTENLPKPLVKVRGCPLIVHALRHLAGIGVREVIVNTHHASGRWEDFFPTQETGGIRMAFRHEPVLLETGGGLKNVEDFFVGRGTFLVYNGDILTTLPLEKAWAHHHRSGNLVTMVLRSGGGPRHVALNSEGRVADIRGMLGSGRDGQYVFTGIQVVEPELFQHMPPVRVESIIPIYLDLIRRGLKIGGVVLDEGEWSDVGSLEEYERISQSLSGG